MSQAQNQDAFLYDGAREETLLQHEAYAITRKVRSVWSGFIEFALRDNVLEVAVGLIIASTFTAVVNSLVTDILLPPLALLPFMSRNLGEQFWTMRKGPNWNSTAPYNTRKQAIDDGAVILCYGTFLDKIISFVGVGFTMYAIANLYTFFTQDSIIQKKIKCGYCRKEISGKSRRCAFCSTWLDGREEKETSALAHPSTS